MSVLTHLKSTAGKLLISESERSSIGRSIVALRARADSYFGDDLKRQVQFGSSIRHTQLPRRVDKRSDVDYMFVFDNNDDLKPQTFLNRIRRFVETRYSTSEVHQSHPTVVLLLNHIRFDLVPADETWAGRLRIPAPATNFADWIVTDPTGFNRKLQDANQRETYHLLPLIRLLKYWNASNGYVFESYSLERELAARSYWLCANLKDYVFTAVEGLSLEYGAAQWRQYKVQRAKRIVEETRRLEAAGLPLKAELEIRKLVPEL